jgi:hypothetical protein
MVYEPKVGDFDARLICLALRDAATHITKGTC